MVAEIVGMTGFEPAAPTTLKWCANRAAPHPEYNKSKPSISFYEIRPLTEISLISA